MGESSGASGDEQESNDESGSVSEQEEYSRYLRGEGHSVFFYAIGHRKVGWGFNVCNQVARLVQRTIIYLLSHLGCFLFGI